MQEDAEILQSALRDIAHAVIQDAESREIENIQPPPHIHLSPGVQVQKSPKRIRNNNVPAFAESTISAVQAALHKYQLVIHELQVICLIFNLFINYQYKCLKNDKFS